LGKWYKKREIYALNRRLTQAIGNCTGLLLQMIYKKNEKKKFISILLLHLIIIFRIKNKNKIKKKIAQANVLSFKINVKKLKI
jgi:hypothetical protein